MEQWWATITVFQQIMFILASVSTFVMLVFLVLMLFGGDEADSFDGDVDTDVDMQPGDPDAFNNVPLSGIAGLRILTVRGALAFVSIGCWSAYAFAGFLHPAIAAAIGAVLGTVAAFLLALAFRASMKLESDGNLDYKNSIGKVGTVYIRVPKKNTGTGKVSVTFQERFSEVDAITNEEEDLTTGTAVEVIGMENETTVIVKKSINAPKK